MQFELQYFIKKRQSPHQHLRHPILNVFCLTRKINAHPNYRLAHIPVGLIVTFLFDLLQGSFGAFIQFVLQDVDVGIGLHQAVDAPVAGT